MSIDGLLLEVEPIDGDADYRDRATRRIPLMGFGRVHRRVHHAADGPETRGLGTPSDLGLFAIIAPCRSRKFDPCFAERGGCRVAARKGDAT